jgi:serine/threonine protein kinase
MTEYPDDNTRTHVVLTKGTMVAHYRIVEKIGAGGMGEVYLAEDTKLSRRVALKFMPVHLASDVDLRLRFTREAQAAAKLDHPNIVPVYEVGEFQGRPFFAMAHIEGKSLRDVIKAGKLSVAESIELTMQICEGLQKAHEAGVVHRDVKPGNIIIDDSSRARLLDFGLATVPGEDRLTKTGSTLGTVGYMAPEQILSRGVDKRADLFSVGVILYEMITGRRPFTGDNDASVVKAITDSIPDPIARFKSGVTGELQQVINKALAKDPSIRYQHADGMLADLKRLGLESPGARKSKPTWWIAAALIVVVGGYFISKLLTAPPETDPQTQLPVLVVLPFKNLGSTADEYFSDGIRDEIGSRLSTVQGLRVISPRSADKYRGLDKSIEQIGQETGADYVLEATIRWDKSGEVDRFRITPKLSKTSDNYLMWADNYEQKLVEVFEVQSEIADEIVTALGLTLLKPGEQAPEYAPTANMEAYNYYLRGLDIMGQGVFMANLSEAIEMFDSALALDPDFALAWAKKSTALTDLEFGHITGDDVRVRAASLEAAEKAVALAPNLPDAHIALGSYYNFLERDYERALDEFALATSEVTSNADLSQAIGVVKMRQGKWQEALEYLEKAARLDPLTVRRYYWLATVHSYLRDFEKTSEYLDRGLALDPANADVVYYKLMMNLLEHGTIDSPDQSFESLVSAIGTAKTMLYEVTPSTTPGFWRYQYRSDS